MKFSNIFLSILLSSCITMQAAQPTSALTEQQVEQLLHDYQDIIDQAIDPSTLQKTIDEAQKQAEEFTKPEVLDLLSQPNGLRIQEQLKFNQELITTITLSKDLDIHLGIYNEDAIRIGLMGAAWGLEWTLHKYLSELIVDQYLQLLIANADYICGLADKKASPSLTLPSVVKQLFPVLSRSMLLMVTAYATTSLALQQAQAYYLPDGSLPASSDQAAKPLSISSLIPFNLFKLATPQTWTTAINDWFIDNGWMSTWTQTMYWAWTKEMFVTLMWLRSFIKNYADQAFNSFITENLAVITPMLKQENTHETLRTLLASELNLTLNTWVMIKTAQASFWHSTINILVATPAWKKIISKTYQLYQAIYSPKGS